MELMRDLKVGQVVSLFKQKTSEEEKVIISFPCGQETELKVVEVKGDDVSFRGTIFPEQNFVWLSTLLGWHNIHAIKQVSAKES